MAGLGIEGSKITYPIADNEKRELSATLHEIHSL
jgi:hypothetical protein